MRGALLDWEAGAAFRSLPSVSAIRQSEYRGSAFLQGLPDRNDCYRRSVLARVRRLRPRHRHRRYCWVLPKLSDGAVAEPRTVVGLKSRTFGGMVTHGRSIRKRGRG